MIETGCDVLSTSNGLNCHQPTHCDDNFQVHGHVHHGTPHHHRTVHLPVSLTSNRVTEAGVNPAGRSFIVLAIFGLLPGIAGIVLLSQASPWEDRVKSPSPFISLGLFLLPFGLLLIMGGLIGFYCVRRRQDQQQTNIPYNTLVRSPPVVAPPQFHDANTGHSPFTDPPPPYWYKDEPPPPYR